MHQTAFCKLQLHARKKKKWEKLQHEFELYFFLFLIMRYSLTTTKYAGLILDTKNVRKISVLRLDDD